MTGYYDIVLGLIPLSLLGGTGMLTTLTNLQLEAAVPIAALTAALLIGHAMFVRGPVDRVAPTTETTKTPSAPAPNAD
ncbi:hypothetical protein [Haloarchaeobius amylolyticus]|uniref:hypothetical protein n=1 Tax=Haloarchaeobius amylolyticus TaxID=1198296 RepID=UPI00226EBAEA|nr:hypothetical protein [Haloarchaeobius amylolyticus]